MALDALHQVSVPFCGRGRGRAREGEGDTAEGRELGRGGVPWQ